VILAGDFNSTILNPKPALEFQNKPSICTSFLLQNNLVSVQQCLPNNVPYTFIPNRSSIDHFLIENTSYSLVAAFTSVSEADVITSDHIPTMLHTNIKIRTQSCVTICNKGIAWNKCTDINYIAYETLVANKILQNNDTLFENNTSYLYDPDTINDLLTQVLHSSASVLPQSKFNKSAKPYWSKEVKEAHSLARKYRREWLSAGRPRGRENATFNNYKIAKTSFRRTQRQHQQEYDHSIHDELNKAADLDYKLFWKLLRSRNRTETNLCCSINVNGVVYNDDDVAEGFRTHFSNIFSDVHSNEKSFDLVNDAFYKESNPRLVHPFSFEEVSTAIRCLAKRKVRDMTIL